MRRVILAVCFGMAWCIGATGLAAAQEAAQKAAPPPEERWEPAMQAFEAQDAEAMPPLHATLFVGSSSIRMWDLPKYFPDLQVINRGFGGSQVADALKYADRIITKYEPKIVVLYAGDNDIGGGKEPKTVLADFRALVKKIHKSLPDCEIFYIAIKPSIKRWELWPVMSDANERIARFAKKTEHVNFVDIGPPMLNAEGKPNPELFKEDGLHMVDAGYKIWTGLLRPMLDAAGAPKL